MAFLLHFMTYTYDEAYQESLKYFNWDELAAKVFVDKYALQNNKGELEELTPSDMHRRIAKEFARVEAKKFKKPLTENKIYSYLEGFKKICMQGSPMYGIGNPYQYVSLGNCFVINSPFDSYLGIIRTDLEITQLTSRRAGVGWDMSKLRPEGSSVKNAAKTTTGTTSFMERFSNTIREIGQNGRRGASLQSISVRHPDILKFIKIKRDLTKVTGSNITVQFSDDFFEALDNGEDFELRWPVCKAHADEMKLPYPVISKKVKAQEIWDEFITGARDYAEPGAAYFDTILSESTSASYKDFGFQEVASNPCGEQYLPANASCRLLLLVLYTFVKNKFTKEAYFDWEDFKDTVRTLQRLGDDLVDLEIESIDRIIDKIKSDPEPNYIKQPGIDLWEAVKKTALTDRRTGCGFTGLGDCLAALGMKYDSDEALKFMEEMQKTFKLEAFRESVDMAKELGAFPIYDAKLDIKSDFIKRIAKEDPELYAEMVKWGRRNMTLLTIAPCGSVSCLTQTSSGLEPVFMLMYTRRKKGNPGDVGFRTDFIDDNGDSWMEFKVYHHGFKEWMDVTGKTEISESPYAGSQAEEIDWIKRIDGQALLQKHIDNSISLTINLPENVTKEKVSELYRYSHKKKCKGCTVYRKGSRSGVLIENVEKPITINNARKRPKEVGCDIYNVQINKEKHFVIIGSVDDSPYEVFLGRGHYNIDKGVLRKVARGHYRLLDGEEVVADNICGKISHDEETITRLISTSLRHNIQIDFVLNQLERTDGDLHSTYKVIARCLKKYIKDGTKVNGEECPECQQALTFQEGCKICKNCGYSACK